MSHAPQPANRTYGLPRGVAGVAVQERPVTELTNEQLMAIAAGGLPTEDVH
jgi:hypothetical protein